MWCGAVFIQGSSVCPQNIPRNSGILARITMQWPSRPYSLPSRMDWWYDSVIGYGRLWYLR